MKPPELSIIMPVYNSAKYVVEAVDSLLSQSYSNFELIIINDASTDGTAELLDNIQDERIRLLNNDKNMGIVYSRNRGLAVARGDFIAPFDGDDVASPEKFEKQIDFLNKNTSYALLGSWVKIIDDKGNLMKQKWRLHARPELIPSILLFRNYFVQSSVVIRRNAIPVGGYKPISDVGEDYRMWIEVARKYPTWNFPDYLIKYRIHGSSITNSDDSIFLGGVA